MSYELTHALLTGSDQGFSGSNVVLTSHYAKGWSRSIPSFVDKVMGTSSDHNINVPLTPTADQALQISSSDAADVGLPIMVTGYNDAFEKIQEVVVTNGQTAVNLTTSFFRISQMMNVSTTTENAGEIFLSVQGASLTAGVPAEADYLYSMKIGNNIGALSCIFLPPGTDHYLYPNYIIYSVINDTNNRVRFEFQTKYSNSSVWLTQFEFYIDEKTNSQFTWPLHGVNKIPLNDLSKGLDIRVIVNKLTNNGAETSASCAWSGFVGI